MKNILSAIFILLYHLVPAQIKQKEYQPVYVNYPDYTVKTTVIAQNKKVNVDRALTYYWYSANKIQETMGGIEGKALHGLYSAFYLNGNLKEKGVFKTGVKNGEWTTWYENGKIKEIITWKKGIRSKSSFNYNSEGAIVSSSEYKNGKLNGYLVQYKNGAVLEKKKYKDGIEVIIKVKEKKEKKEKKSKNPEKKSSFSEKYKIIKAKITNQFSDLKSKKKKETKEIELNEVKKEKNKHPEILKKTEKDKNTLTLKKKETTEKKKQNKTTGK